jgi:drug/metabolite transporter (DMT)-like permease
MNMEPVAGMILGWLVLGQVLGALQVVGGLIVVGGIVALAYRR